MGRRHLINGSPISSNQLNNIFILIQLLNNINKNKLPIYFFNVININLIFKLYYFVQYIV